MTMTDIKSMTQEEITDALRAMGEPAFRGKQVFSWLHKGATDFAEMNNLSKPLREKLGKEFTITAPTVARKQVSRLDGTVKYLWELRDGNCIETVLMSYHHGNTVCISSQVGCRMGCKFCASTIAGKVRDLTPSEMLDQVLFTQLDSGKDISNIVLMGIGEPLDNRANVLRFLQLVNHPEGLNIGMRHISLSTCGVVPGIDALAEENLQLTLSVSLHAPDSANGSVWQAIQVGAKTLGDWVRAFYRMRQGDLLLVQYPYFPVKGYGVARLALHLLRWKGVKTAALVHDLDSLRRIGGSAARGSDQLLLPGFEALIVHSQRMESYLRTVGVTCPMILMEAFDCLSEGKIPVREKSRMVAIAGNLAADKSGYLKDIGKVPLEWQLYGTNWAGSDSTRIEYHGEIAPEKLPETISGAFGIVWDGDSLDGLTGLYGVYALLNSPHKLSTYLAGGLPVIVAKNAAAADFVAREQVGVALNSLRELPELIHTMPEEDYQRYASNARRVGAQLRAGENTKRALRKLEEVE